MSLKVRLQKQDILVAPGVYDGLTASLATEAGVRSALSKRCSGCLHPPWAARYWAQHMK